MTGLLLLVLVVTLLNFWGLAKHHTAAVNGQGSLVSTQNALVTLLQLKGEAMAETYVYPRLVVDLPTEHDTDDTDPGHVWLREPGGEPVGEWYVSEVDFFETEREADYAATREGVST